jgi:hypothetical protein
MHPAELISPTQRQAMNPNPHESQLGHRVGHVDRVAPQPVQLGDDQHVILFHLVQQPQEAGALFDRGGA